MIFLQEDLMAKPNRYTPEMIEKYTTEGYWEPRTFSDLWDQSAMDYPNKEAVVDSKTRLTWGQAKQWIDRLALGLLDQGLKKDQMLVVQLPNSVELCLLRIACEKAGLLFMPVLRTFRRREMEYILSHVEATGVVIPWQFRDFDYFEMIKEIRTSLPGLKYVFLVGDEAPGGTLSIKAMSEQPLEEKYPSSYLEGTKTKATEFSLVVPTTGSTGFPKFVEIPSCSHIFSGKYFVKAYQITASDIVAVLAPAALGPNIIAYCCVPRVGAKMVMMEHFEAEEALKLIERERVTIAGVVPTQLVMMAGHPNLKEYDISSLRFIRVTGAPLTYQVAVEAEENVGCPIIQGYGAVEFGTGSTSILGDPREVRLLTAGKPLPGCEVKLVDEGNEVPRGEVGEIMLAGPVGVSGYYRDPDTTWKVWTRDGWYRTGDRGKLDDRGKLVILGRQKDMIIRGGQNIYPTEIENLLISHPRVSGAAVVGMPDPVMGERVCAYVAPKENQTYTFDEMISFLKQKSIAPYKLPERLELVDSIPMVGAGQKVDKKELKQDISEKLKAEGKI